MFWEWCRGHWMSVVLYLYVCPFVCNWVEKNLYLCKTPMYFNYLEYFHWYYVILCCWGSFCVCLLILVTIFRLLTKIHQNQFFLYFYGFKLLVWYNLVLCYSLDPVLVIWHVTLIIFYQNQVFFSKFKKSKFW